ncbi:hypothetical protein C8F04DRAFT_1184306 [Mycena alexandri]|uniref:Uncharacterized protein n=1 Tax=Mycena alexandri TaxID=1745969 RepID=A0AAD6X3B9_9AGAR|nr:hypothetical protein C8F04DRAFT_1184306 [Mycena alexandri]
MEKVPYIDAPRPFISTRQEWRLFSRRALPVICARLTQEELLQLTGGDLTRDTDFKGLSAPSDPPLQTGGEAPPRNHVPQDDTSSASNQPNTPTPSSTTATTAQDSASGSEGLRNQVSSAKHRVKPRGQPNRPGSGGYNLENYMVQLCGWTQDQFAEVQGKVHALAGEKLDVKKQYPITRGFDQSWVIRDMLKANSDEALGIAFGAVVETSGKSGPRRTATNPAVLSIFAFNFTADVDSTQKGGN